MRKLKDDPVGAGRPVPSIQLKGHWLNQAMFEINVSVKIRIMHGCLVLIVENKPATSLTINEVAIGPFVIMDVQVVSFLRLSASQG